MPSQGADNAVQEVVRAIMILDRSKKPFRKLDIVPFLSQKPGRNWESTLLEAKKSLRGLGLELVEANGTCAKTYFLVSKNHPLPVMYKYASPEEVSGRTLLTLVLTYIFMKNGTVTSEDMLNHLKSLSIFSETQPLHPYFGDVKKRVFTDFVDQLYLSCSKVPDSDLVELSWGQRAEVEVPKKSILEFVCHCGYEDKIEPKNLVAHYKKATEQESQISSQGGDATCMEIADD